MHYKIKRQVTLTVEGKNRNDAIKNSREWQGEYNSISSNGYMEWNGETSLISAKKVSDRQQALWDEE